MGNKSVVKRMTEMLADRGYDEIYAVEYMDSEMNRLSAEDILFTDEEHYNGRQTLDVWGDEEREDGFYSVYSEGVEMIFDDDCGNFPVALVTPGGRIMYLKVSARTGEILPMHVGCCQSVNIVFTGAPSSGKTVHSLQLSDSVFHDLLARNTDCSFEDDLPLVSPVRKRYDDIRDDMKRGILPEPNRRGDIIMPYVYYCKYKDEHGMYRHLLLRLQDVDGQECVDLSWDSKVLPYDHFFLMIGADELLMAERGEAVSYTKVIDRLIPRLRIQRQRKDYEMVVIITKCDLLDREHPYLKDAFCNSIEMVNGKMTQTTHSEGFHYDVFEHRCECVELYLKDQCPNVYNKLVNSVPGQKLTFTMIASIGHTCEGGEIKEYHPFCIDEPILSVMAKNDMYPIAVYSEKRPIPETIPGRSPFGGAFKNFMRQIRELVLPEDEPEEWELTEDIIEKKENRACRRTKEEY